MTQSLHDALADLATEAGMYADAEAAVTRRRRHVRTLAGASTAAVVLALVAGMVVLLPRAERTAPPVGPAEPPTSAASALPRRVSVPAAVEPLPAEGAVGRAELVYTACHRTCRQPLLLSADGRQYGLIATTQGQPARWVTLSPDGRWLGQLEGGAYVLRDLAGSRRHSLPGDWDPWTWSADSRWLLLAEHHDGDVRTYTMLDLTSGRTRSLAPRPEWGQGFAVLPSGHFLVPTDYAAATRGRMTYQVIDPGARRAVRTVVVDVRSVLRRGETVQPELRVSSDGTTALVTVLEDREPDDVSRPSAVVVARLADGGVTARHDLPRSGLGAGDEGGVWEPQEPTAGGMLLVHSEATRTSVVGLDLRTGRRQVLATLPGNVPVLVPGRARY